MTERIHVSYQSSQLKTPYTFLYPADWRVREIVEDGYLETCIAGPPSRAGTYSISFTVGVLFASDQTPEGAATALVSSHRSAFRCQELARTTRRVAGTPAVEVEIAYSMPLPLNSVNAQPTAIRERHIFLKHGGQLYELVYAAPEEDYATWLEAFRTLAETFAFTEEPDDQAAYQPMAVATPQHIREEPSGYEAKKDQSDGKPA
jgi:hypothetical protein